MLNKFNILNILKPIILHTATYNIIINTWPTINNFDSLSQRVKIIIV